MAIRTELNLRLPNSPGALEGVCRLLSDERVNITAMALEATGQLRLVLDNHVHGAAVLREHHHQVAERNVIVTSIPNAPGSLAPVLGLLGVTSAGRAVAEQHRGGLPGLRDAHHVWRRVVGGQRKLDVLEPGVTVVIGEQAGDGHHGGHHDTDPRG